MGTACRRGHWLVCVPFLLALFAWPASAAAATGHEHPSAPAATHSADHDHAKAGHDDHETADHDKAADHDEVGGHDDGTPEPAGTDHDADHGGGPTGADVGHGPDDGDGHSDHESTAPDEDRPLGLLLGGFGAVNGVALVAAATLRRRNRAVDEQRRARRTAKRAVPPHRTGTR